MFESTRDKNVIDLDLHIDIMKLKKERMSLVGDMENYYKIYKHRNSCVDWKKSKWCEHYVKARAKKFKTRVGNHMIEFLSTKKKLIYSRHISE